MVSHITSNKLTANELAVCGGIAGFITRMAISPLDVIKIRLQVQPERYSLFTKHENMKYTGIHQAFKKILAEEGIRGLFKGNVPAQWLYVTYGASQLYAYHYLDRFLNRKEQQIPFSLKPFISGMFAGSFATATTYPFDLLRTRFAMQGTRRVYDSISHAILDIYKKESIRGFYRGLGSSITQIMPYMGLMFYSYEGLSSILPQSEKHQKIQDMLCGSLAGIISKTGVFPLDVIRKRLQVQGPHLSEYAVSTIPNYSNVMGCMKKIIQTEGFLGLYKGLLPGLLKAGPSGAVYFLAFEISKDCLVFLNESGFSIVTINEYIKFY